MSYPSDGPLAGVMLKLARGSSHLDRLNAEILGWVDEGPYATPVEIDEQGGLVYSIEIATPPPPLFGLIVGEWAHNARSALDALAHELVVLHGGKTGTHVGFPISLKQEHWDKRVENPKQGILSMLDGLAPSGVAFAAIKKLQPYIGRNRPQARVTELGTLASLNNLDKHEAIHGAAGVRGNEPPQVVFDPPEAVAMVEYTFFVPFQAPLEGRTKFVRAFPYYAPGWEQTELDGYLDYSLDVTFGQQGVAFGGLWRIQRFVCDIVASFCRAVLDPEPGFVPLWDRLPPDRP